MEALAPLMVGWPLMVARLKVAVAAGSAGPLPILLPYPVNENPGFCGSLMNAPLPPKPVPPLPPLNSIFVGLPVTSNVPPMEHG
jgi:hypothetical protein